MIPPVRLEAGKPFGTVVVYSDQAMKHEESRVTKCAKCRRAISFDMIDGSDEYALARTVDGTVCRDCR